MNYPFSSLFIESLSSNEESSPLSPYLVAWKSKFQEWSEYRDEAKCYLTHQLASEHQVVVANTDTSNFSKFLDFEQNHIVPLLAGSSHLQIRAEDGHPELGKLAPCLYVLTLLAPDGSRFGNLSTLSQSPLNGGDIQSLQMLKDIIERDLELLSHSAIVNEPSEDQVSHLKSDLANPKVKFQNEIHTLKETRNSLRRSEANFSSLVQNIPGIVYHCACDSDWTMHLISDDVELVTGYPASDFIQNKVRTWADSLYHEDRDYVEECVMKGVNDNETFTLEYRIQHKDGSIRWAYEQGQAIRGSDGELLWLDGVILDITEKKLAEFELLKSEKRGQMLKEVAISANAAPKVSEVLQSALDSICHYSGWPAGNVYLINNERTELTSSSMWHIDNPEKFGALKKVTKRYSYSKGVGIPGTVWETQQAYWSEDVQTDPTFRRTILGEDLNIKSTFGFPIKTDGQVIAVLEFFSDKPQAQDDDLLHVIQKIGEQLEIVLKRKHGELQLLQYQDNLEAKVKNRTIELENANINLAHSIESLKFQDKIMSNDLQMAKQLQTSFLPDEFPFSDTIRFGGFYDACDTIGGDLYDVFKVTDRVAGLYIADVSGHGVSAAMVTAVLKVTIDRAIKHLRSETHEQGQPLSTYINTKTFIDELNSEMYKITAEDKFITFQLILLNIQDGQMLILNAGHTRPIKISGSSAAPLNIPSNMPVGLLSKFDFETLDTTLDQGDKMVVYTDGLTERVNPEGAEFGEERLLSATQQYKDQDPNDFCHSIMHLNSNFSEGAEVSDDIALLVAEYL